MQLCVTSDHLRNRAKHQNLLFRPGPSQELRSVIKCFINCYEVRRQLESFYWQTWRGRRCHQRCQRRSLEMEKSNQVERGIVMNPSQKDQLGLEEFSVCLSRILMVQRYFLNYTYKCLSKKIIVLLCQF